MKSLSVLFFLITVCIHASSASETVKLDLGEVKVYLSGAELIHSARLNLKAGNNEYVFENIAGRIAPNSINAYMTGNASILEISERDDYLSPKENPAEVKRLQDSLELLNMSASLKRNEISALDAEAEILAQNKIISTKEKSLTPADLKLMAQLYHESVLRINNDKLRINNEINKITGKITVIQNQLNEINGRTGKSVHQILMTIYSKTAQTIDLSVKYFTNDASWSPSYDVRVKDINSPLAFYHKANVWQNCGIDFRDVKLSLSTRDPLVYGDIPRFNPVTLDFSYGHLDKSAYVGTRNKISTQNNEPDVIRVDGLDVGNQFTGGFQEANRSFATSVSAEFTTDLNYSIPSDGKPHHVDLAPTELPGAFEYYTAPKYRTESFLVAKITGWEDAGLVPGEANVYFENSYIGKTGITPDITTDTMNLSLGVDRNVIVKRDIIKDFTETKTFSSNIERTFGYKISVKNSKKTKIRITIEDQIPVSKNEDIKVKLIEGDGSEPDEDTGKIKWVVDIEPGKTIEKVLKFSVRHPANKPITSF